MSINTMSKSFFYLDTLINFAIIRLMLLKKSIIQPQGKNKKPVMALETQVIWNFYRNWLTWSMTALQFWLENLSFLQHP